MYERDSAAPLSFAGFLEKMKDPAAADLVRHIKGYSRVFAIHVVHHLVQSLLTCTYYPHRYIIFCRFIRRFETRPISHLPDPEQDSAAVQTFLSQMESLFRVHPLWKNSNYEILDQAVEGLEKYLMSKIWSRTFAVGTEDKDRDERYLRLASALSFVDLSTLIGVPVDVEDSLLSIAVEELLKMDKYKAPRDKLLCLVNVKTLVEDIVTKAAQGGTPIGGADAFFPVFLLVVIRGCMPRLASTIEYIRRFRAQTQLSGQFDFMLCNLESAAVYLDTVDWKHLKISREEFLMRLAEAGIPEADMALRSLSLEEDHSNGNVTNPSSRNGHEGVEEGALLSFHNGNAHKTDSTMTLTSLNEDVRATSSSPSANLIDLAIENNSLLQDTKAPHKNDNDKGDNDIIDGSSGSDLLTGNKVNPKESRPQKEGDVFSLNMDSLAIQPHNGAPPSLLLDLDAAIATGGGMEECASNLTPLPGGIPATPILLNRHQGEEGQSNPAAKKSLIALDSCVNDDMVIGDHVAGHDENDEDDTQAMSIEDEHLATKILLAEEMQKTPATSALDSATDLASTSTSSLLMLQKRPMNGLGLHGKTTTTTTTTDTRGECTLQKSMIDADANETLSSIVVDGTGLVLEEESSGRLQEKYPWIYAAAEDLSVGDVHALLASYRDAVFKYEALSLSLKGQLGGGGEGSRKSSSNGGNSTLLNTLFGSPADQQKQVKSTTLAKGV